jgi:hypothetical protein
VVQRRGPDRAPQDCGGPEAFLALREEHGRWATTVRIAELTGLPLAASPTSTVREVLGEAIEELPGLLYWSGMLAAEGTSALRNVYVIDRGYELLAPNGSICSAQRLTSPETYR